MTRPGKLALTLSLTTLALPVFDAHAQRGLMLPDQVQRSESPSAGIAGFFDTNTTTERHITADLPTSAIDFGLTPNVTIGTNALTLLGLTAVATQTIKMSVPPLLAKLRYRVFAHNDWSGAATGYLFGLKTNTQALTSSASISQTIVFSGATLNIAQDFGDSSWGLSYFGARLSFSGNDSQTMNSGKSERVLQLASAWWRKTLAQKLESEILLLTCPLYETTDTSPLIRIDSKEACFGRRIIDPALRAVINWRSTEQWLWTAGVIWLPHSDNKVFPVLGVAYIFSLGSNESEE